MFTYLVMAKNSCNFSVGCLMATVQGFVLDAYYRSQGQVELVAAA
jgi:hypothetical protein